MGSEHAAAAGRRPESDFPPGIGNPARRALEAAGYVRLAQLAGVSERELLRLHGMGPKAIGILRQALAREGMAFAESDPGRTGR